jgi:DNA-directed RNA polymerase specialized sigma subunit
VYSKDEVAKRVEQLPETDQLILSLRYELGLSFAEIGLILDLEEHTVGAIHGWAVQEVLGSK